MELPSGRRRMQTWKLLLALAVAAEIAGAEKGAVAKSKSAQDQVSEVALAVDGDVRAKAVADVDDEAMLLTTFRAKKKATHDGSSTSLRCRMCGAHLAWKSDAMALPAATKGRAKSYRHEATLGESGEVTYFDGPLGDEFELAAFELTEASATESYSEEDSFFDDYNWRVLTCPRCARHVGWKFTHDLQEQCMKLAKHHLAPAPSTAAIAELKATVDTAFAKQKCHVMANGWWSYQVCYESEVRQFHEEADGSRPFDWSMGRFTEDRSTEKEVVHHYTGGQTCDENGQARATTVKYVCCAEQPEIAVDTIDEPSLCEYNIRVCVPSLCAASSTPEVAAKKTAEQRELEATCSRIVGEAAPSVLPHFYTLLWPDTLADDSRDLAWAHGLRAVTSIGR
ncbi:hypothetical protein SDRG_05256 [Saprolegnia diclina VS20]|uniref:Uncharacterized protein n=1 Tax=Saprolegnia diclina (strain VS20) TaxID=1156394 RepID=T0QI49_SAPDV|nr:hypothetical protein SDRG_05256 [Saprolegnia diclina VS20]EQC37669.1 hypothetical protein SDRG_05256 [Saprolegnia diclina VS20]|eukprot:XP_008609189.1 hypothetical protein SDRG_05256 [Saprolegnia diclina VS20]